MNERNEWERNKVTKEGETGENTFIQHSNIFILKRYGVKCETEKDMWKWRRNKQNLNPIWCSHKTRNETITSFTWFSRNGRDVISTAAWSKLPLLVQFTQARQCVPQGQSGMISCWSWAGDWWKKCKNKEEKDRGGVETHKRGGVVKKCGWGHAGGERGGRWGCECVVVVEMMWMEEKEGEEMEELGKEWKEINQSNENWIGEKILKMIDGNEEQEWKGGKGGMRNEMMCGNSHNTPIIHHVMNWRPSNISLKMKVVNVHLKQCMLVKDSSMIVDNLIQCLVEVLR